MKKAKITSFKNIQRDFEQAKKFSYDKINIVIIQIGGRPEQRNKLKEIETWAKQYLSSQITMTKIIKQEFIIQTYLSLMKQNSLIFMVSLLPISQLQNEPVKFLYENQKDSTILDINSIAKDNIDRFRYILIWDNAISQLDKINFYHPCMTLITSDTQKIKQLISKNFNKKTLNKYPSTSSINSQEAADYMATFTTKIEEGAKTPYKEFKKKDKQLEAIKLIQNTPGVGSYNIGSFVSKK